MKRTYWVCAVAAWALVSAAAAQQPQDRETKVRGDKTKVETAGYWIYNDLPAGIAKAKLTGKPLLVVFRCIPCEHCAQLDESVVERDLAIRKLLDEYVAVRIVQANGMDLSRFQFDYDQSWAAFFMNADQTIYGRYGTRSHRTESENDISVQGFGKALQASLDLHREYPGNRATLAGKQSSAPEVPGARVPEEYAFFKGRYGSKLDYQGKVVQSCIHCHQVREAQRAEFRLAGKPFPESILFPYPHPKIVGLRLDPKSTNRVAEVPAGSPAAKAGFRAGDEIVTLEGQPVLSTADLQWVLHHAGPAASLKAQVRRDGKALPLTLALTPGWRQRDDLSWRATTWELRRMALGGLVLEELPDAERRAAGLGVDALALRVQHVGQYGEHATAKRVGFQKDDVVVAVGGETNRLTETALLAYLVNAKRPGEKVPFSVLRGGERREITLPMQ